MANIKPFSQRVIIMSSILTFLVLAAAITFVCCQDYHAFNDYYDYENNVYRCYYKCYPTAMCYEDGTCEHTCYHVCPGVKRKRSVNEGNSHSTYLITQCCTRRAI